MSTPYALAPMIETVATHWHPSLVCRENVDSILSIARTVPRWQCAGVECRLGDPAPRADIEGAGVMLVRSTVQQAGLTHFSALCEGDVLFIDSSHILMPGTDVDVLCNRILPNLPNGIQIFPGSVPLYRNGGLVGAVGLLASALLQRAGGRVVGVETVEGEEVAADAVVSNAAGVGTYLELVDDTPPARQPVQDLANILSLHLELAEADRERQLAADARLNALRAQINPHFLFNTLNTITSKARTDPEEARRLLVRLSDFFRYSIRQDGHFADFAQEYFFVRTYLSLEQARYGESLHVRFDVDPQVLSVQVPVLTIQPLIENAVKHGLAEKVGGGTVHLKARVDPLSRTTLIQVRDDGVGMDDELLDKVLYGAAPSGGIGLRNINQRLEKLFGERYSMHVRSGDDKGTTVDLRLPLR